MTLYDFLSGAVAFGFFVLALFFARFWQRSGEQLFGCFAIAFALLGVSQAVFTLGGFPVEERSWIYLGRLLAFSLILVAIVRKNRVAG